MIRKDSREWGTLPYQGPGRSEESSSVPHGNPCFLILLLSRCLVSLTEKNSLSLPNSQRNRIDLWIKLLFNYIVLKYPGFCK